MPSHLGSLYALRRIMLNQVHSLSPITLAKKSWVHCAGHLQEIRPDAKAHHTYILALYVGICIFPSPAPSSEK